MGSQSDIDDSQFDEKQAMDAERQMALDAEDIKDKKHDEELFTASNNSHDKSGSHDPWQSGDPWANKSWSPEERCEAKM
eukprot:9149742-Karenia_brevis.AAC.1